MIRNYHIPVDVDIDADNPDVLMRRIAEVIHDAIADFMDSSEASARLIDVKYSIFIKADAQTFGQQ